jgi:pentatricopeptide repeat protein
VCVVGLLGQGDAERALRVFAKMKESRISPDNYTYCALLAACGNVTAGLDGGSEWSQKEVARRIVAIEKDMASSSVQHTQASVSALVSFYCLIVPLASGSYFMKTLMTFASLGFVVFTFCSLES